MAAGAPAWLVLFTAYLRGAPSTVGRRNGRTGTLRMWAPPLENVRKTCSDVSSIHRKVRSINTFSTSHVDVMCITNIRNQHAADISCGWCRLRPYAIVLALHGWLTLSASSEGGSNGLERTLQQQGGRDRRDRGRPSCWRTVRLPVGHITVIL